MGEQAKVAIFDLGATLIAVPTELDEEDRIAELYHVPNHVVDFLSQQICRSFRSLSSDQYVAHLGAAINERWPSTMGLEELSVAAMDAVRRSVTGSILQADAVSALTTLRERGMKLCLISNTNPVSWDRIRHHEIDKFFDEIIFSCDVGLSKPDPRIFDLAFTRFGLPPADFCAIGDRVRTIVLGISHLGTRTVLVERRARKMVISTRLPVSAIVPDLISLCTLRWLGGEVGD